MVKDAINCCHIGYLGAGPGRRPARAASPLCHVTNIYAKIDAQNRSEATAYAIRHGLS